MPLYEMMDESGTVVLETRFLPDEMLVGAGAIGDYARMRLAAVQPVFAPEPSRLTAEELAEALRKKGALTKAEIDAERGKK